MNWIEACRNCWGKIFNDLSLASGYANSAWYQTENKSALIDEEVRRLHAIIAQAQKSITMWEGRRSQ